MLMSRMLTVICFVYSVLVLLKQQQQSELENFLCSASAGPPNPEEDDGSHNPRGADKQLERSGQ